MKGRHEKFAGDNRKVIVPNYEVSKGGYITFHVKNRTYSLACVVCGMVAILLACNPEPKVTGELSPNQDPTMRLWHVYDHCRRATNLEEQKGQALLLHHSVLLQPDDEASTNTRRSVDIEALAASCNLLAGSAVMEAGEIREARTLYQLALLHANTPDLASVKEQAQSALDELRTSLQ
jgi:hypothetical protein